MTKRRPPAQSAAPLSLQTLLAGERHVLATNPAWTQINAWYRAGLISMRITNARDAAWISLTTKGREIAKRNSDDGEPAYAQPAPRPLAPSSAA